VRRLIIKEVKLGTKEQPPQTVWSVFLKEGHIQTFKLRSLGYGAM
jgi:hypothetical protein